MENQLAQMYFTLFWELVKTREKLKESDPFTWAMSEPLNYFKMKSKLSYLPFNLLWCSGTFFGSLFLTQNLDLYSSIGISLLFYSIDLRSACAEDWLKDRISKLEQK